MRYLYLLILFTLCSCISPLEKGKTKISILVNQKTSHSFKTFDISPSSFTENTESIITLSYSDTGSGQASSCEISNLSHVTITTACSCSLGVCKVGVTGTSNYNGAASFDYTVTSGLQTSNTATATLNITVPPPFTSIWRTTAPGQSITLPLVSGYTYNAVVDWGDASPTSAVTTFNDPDITHTYAAAGDYTVTITGVMEAWSFNYFGDKNKIIEVVNLGSMGWKNLNTAFGGCGNLVAFAGGETASVTDMSWMFSDNYNLTNLNLSSFNTASVTNMNGMFYYASSLTSLDLSSFDTASVTNMNNMFYYTTSLTSLNLSSFNTASVTDMSWMFYGSSGLSSLDLSSFNTASVTNMSLMFGDTTFASLDLSSFNTVNVIDMSAMFESSWLLTSLDLSNFNTSSVTDMSYMFNNASGLTSLNLSSFNTASVTNMNNMFYYATSLTSLNLSNFNTASVTSMSGMFQETSSLTSLNANTWNVGAVTNSSNIWTSSNAGLVVTCDQGGFPATGSLFGETCF